MQHAAIIQQSFCETNIGGPSMAQGELTTRLHETAKRRDNETTLIGLNPDGVTWADLIALQARRDDSRVSRQDKNSAAAWVAAHWFKTPIAPQRWEAIGPRVREELAARAQANGTSPATELQESVVQAVLIALGDAAGDVLTANVRGNLLSRLNDLVAEDLLGTEWRQLPPEEIEALANILIDHAAQAAVVELELRLDLDALVSRANLGKREAQIVAAVREGTPLVDAAEKLGITPGAARVAVSRARKKMRAIASM